MYMAVLTVIVKKEEPYKVIDAVIYEWLWLFLQNITTPVVKETIFLEPNNDLLGKKKIMTLLQSKENGIVTEWSKPEKQVSYFNTYICHLYGTGTAEPMCRAGTEMQT